MGCQQIHFHMQVIKRSEGRNAVACASYRHALAMYDERTGVKFDFSKSNEEHIGFSQVLAPVSTPLPLLESESLWQSVEFAEKRNDAQLCREFDAALPMELTKSQKIELMQEFCQSNFVDCGMICDINMHDKEDNPHFHTMITMRDIDPDAEYGFGKKNRKWNRKDLVDIWRHNYEECINKHLSMAGIDRKYSCETLEAQGIDRIPQIHKGSAAIAIAEGGGQSWKVEKNDNIIDFNQASAKLKARKTAAEKAVEQEDEHAKIEKTHALALEMEAQRQRAMQNYLLLVGKFERRSEKRSQWIDMKSKASQFPKTAMHWKETGSTLRKLALKVIHSMREAILDYLSIYGRDLRQDAWESVHVDPYPASTIEEPSDDIEINGP